MKLPGRDALRGRAAAPEPAPQGAKYASSPLLAAKTPIWRSRFLVLGVGLTFGLLIGRAVYIQVVNQDFFQQQGESRYQRTFALQASRGRITDRTGQVLAASVPAQSIWVIPKDFNASPAERQTLAKLLGMAPADLNNRLKENPNFVWLRRLVDDSVAAQIKALALKGVHQQREYRREYPEGEAAAHVVGFTNVEQRGQEGIELAFQKDLDGRNGSRSVVRDRLGNVIEDIGERVEPADGHDIALSIDARVQFVAYQQVRDAVIRHKAKAGSAVVLDTQTGEVLALANYPSYTPGDRLTRTGANLRNRALTDTFEPGSTMKPFITALAMQSGRVNPSTIIQTAPGSITITGSTIRDSHPHGALTVQQVLQKSSNVGTVKMAMQMQPREMWDLYHAVGFGQKPPLVFPGLASGKLRAYKTWRPIEQATMSYGYGLSTSLFQLARAYSVFARDGDLVPVSLVRQPGPVAGEPVFRPEVVREVRTMLQMAAGEGGTAPKAQAVGYSVGGKTGTARKQDGGRYASNKYRAWFVGMAPVQAPRIVVAVMVDEPDNGTYYGGEVAAPVFSQVVQQTLRVMGVPPDLEIKPQIIARAQAAKAEQESF
ncbi:penicillin-binding protein 2 [Sphaerotilus sp.]|uniref:peptidoglycan D,D-transpeptidase FtsI family protein n=1 Tax=Sphaerotilus sp. TaxID=2093942 RepID=UPI002ACDB8F9|nr:penicillin-binding protein 2 [Sphaerotilus sp.]MDZ7855137.1 penicillin-binding protein 2 [Sphaerotilus sp.]